MLLKVFYQKIHTKHSITEIWYALLEKILKYEYKTKGGVFNEEETIKIFAYIITHFFSSSSCVCSR